MFLLINWNSSSKHLIRIITTILFALASCTFFVSYAEPIFIGIGIPAVGKVKNHWTTALVLSNFFGMRCILSSSHARQLCSLLKLVKQD